MSKTVLFSITQASALLREDKSAVSRKAASGVFGAGHVDPGQVRRRYTLSAIEAATGKHFTPEQVEAARESHVYRGPSKAEAIAMLRERMMLRLVAAIDGQWKAALVGQTLINFVPPTRGKHHVK